MPKNLKLILLTISALIFGYAGGFNTPKEQVCPLPENQYNVASVTDGDTIRVKDIKIDRVRLLGLNSPEKGECYFKESKEVMESLLTNQKVRLDKDVTLKDQYNRDLRYVFLIKEDQDNIFINDYLIRNGYAFYKSVPPDTRYRDLFSSAQEEAKKQRKGLWGLCEVYNEVNALRESDPGPQDPNCLIKGNISEKGFGKTYLVKGCDNYNRVKIDPRKGETYFCTEKEAQAAGFRKATNCP